MLPVVSGDGIVEPGVRGDKPVCDGAVATGPRIGGGPLPVARHNSMSLLQAPRGTSLDGGARVVGAGIGASSSVVEVRSSMPGFIGFEHVPGRQLLDSGEHSFRPGQVAKGEILG